MCSAVYHYSYRVISLIHLHVLTGISFSLLEADITRPITTTLLNAARNCNEHTKLHNGAKSAVSE